jgi:hypothetical protein
VHHFWGLWNAGDGAESLSLNWVLADSVLDDILDTWNGGGQSEEGSGLHLGC